MRRVSVLIVQRILPPYRLAFFRELCASPQIDVCVAYGTNAGASALRSVQNPSGVKTERLRNIFPVKGDKLVIQRGLLSLLRSGDFDVVIAEFNLRIVTNVVACIAAKLLGRKFVWWGHGVSPTSGGGSLRLRLLLARFADAMIFYDEGGAKRFIALGVPQQKVFVATNSIDTEEIAPLVEQRPLAKRHRILYVGRLLPGKKVELLIRAFARALPRLRHDVELTIIGSGPEQKRLAQVVEQLDLLKHVCFVPALYEQVKLAPYFNSAYVSVSPGFIGLGAIHSLAYGVPVLVARDEPHRPEVNALEENIDAIFFNSDDVENLTLNLVSLADDSSRHERMSCAGFDKIHNGFGVKPMVNAFERAVAHAQGNQT